MSWLTRVRDRLPFMQKRETPDNLWVKCPRCDHHGRIGAEARLEQVMDAGYKLIDLPEVRQDPLKFRDQKRYADRLKQARAKTGQEDAFLVAEGKIEGQPAVVGVQDFSFMGGSMGMAVGTAFCAGAERALSRKCPYIVFTAAGGARMQEGILSLMQMPKATVMTRRLKEAGLPFVVVLTDPTTGGVTASYAMLGDVHIAEPGALIGFAGQRVIQETIREQLPEGFQRAEYLHKHGMVDMVVPRAALRERLAQLIGYMSPAEAA